MEEHGLDEEAADKAIIKSMPVIKCKSCGMPMRLPEEHGGGNENNPYCRFCANEDGTLKKKKQVEINMIKYVMKEQGAPKKEAEKTVKKFMAKMPAWRK